MGILIHGLDLPENEPLIVKINPDGTVSTTWKNNYKKYTAIPVPTPHGRLGDLNVLYEKFSRLESEAMNALKTTNTGSVNWIKWSSILTERTGYKNDIADAPTTIPAEPEEEE